MSILLKNALLMCDVRSEPKLSDLLVEDGKIAGIGNFTEAAVDEVHDMSGKLVMPGFVNAHTHAAMALMRGSAEDMRLQEWLLKKIFPIEERLTPEDVYYGTMMAQLEMARKGVVAYVDMYFHCDAVVQAALDFGMKALITRGLTDHDGDNGRLKQNIEYFERWNGKQGLISIGFGPHAPYSCSLSYIDQIARVALELGAPITMHLFESPEEDYSLKEILKTQLRECKVIFAHCVHIPEKDIELLSSENFFVAHNPTSNLKLGNGVAPIQKMIEKNVQVCLGTDGAASNNTLDVWHEMRLAALLQKASDPRNISIHQALNMAIEQGAKAVGLTPGKIEIDGDADLIVVDLNKPWYVPLDRIKNHIVHSANSLDVFATMIKGRWVYYDGEYPTVDTEYIFEKCEEAIRRLTGTTS
ncbi:MAG: 5-methylthioadenosine/S-adenosylhomocysteine deaminase [Thermotoga sp. 50_1627]|uniref:amidohydrolase n=1 Tax=Pseudothermotoga sp. TaxID=2033661 RepID=UPI00076D6676|nr:MAG: 5-methylthioadenosine/S-adenosylhomocysteine deaminase [Thermotoga sp. 50_64]KUK25948.1 MAG: 5-methylthioadenosine/S-adenosylhomocysteine deaminase [Thermotoga sp. 50_1627]HBT38611.1 S-adenosylhomocysteine deaminase [Pseudothermotoga sp.]HCO98124.1 S-adenosylhomocysteine deaminase [Pseudothermotoga sp.]